jgi:hypothetical protein
MRAPTISPRGELPEVPRARSIASGHICSAYVLGRRKQRRRIEEFGRISRETLRDLGATIKTVQH